MYDYTAASHTTQHTLTIRSSNTPLGIHPRELKTSAHTHTKKKLYTWMFTVAQSLPIPGDTAGSFSRGWVSKLQSVGRLLRAEKERSRQGKTWRNLSAQTRGRIRSGESTGHRVIAAPGRAHTWAKPNRQREERGAAAGWRTGVSRRAGGANGQENVTKTSKTSSSITSFDLFAGSILS